MFLWRPGAHAHFGAEFNAAAGALMLGLRRLEALRRAPEMDPAVLEETLRAVGFEPTRVGPVASYPPGSAAAAQVSVAGYVATVTPTFGGVGSDSVDVVDVVGAQLAASCRAIFTIRYAAPTQSLMIGFCDKRSGLLAVLWRYVDEGAATTVRILLEWAPEKPPHWGAFSTCGQDRHYGRMHAVAGDRLDDVTHLFKLCYFDAGAATKHISSVQAGAGPCRLLCPFAVVYGACTVQMDTIPALIS